jgi:hypothetical protein
MRKTVIRVRKDLPRGKGAPQLNNIADVLAGHTRISLIHGMKRFKNQTQVEDIALKLAVGDEEGAVNAVPWEKMPDNFDPMTDVIARGVEDGAKEAIKYFPQVLKPAIRFDPTHPRIQDFIANHTAKLVKEVGDGTRKAIKTLVTNGMDRGIGPKQLGRMVREHVGLTERQSIAVDRFHMNLLEQGVPEELAHKRMVRYATKQRNWRAENIARTESVWAVNAGQNEIWRQAAEQGIVDGEHVMREWVIDPVTACKICEPINGQKVELDQPFQTDVGPLDGPPAHPQCNCGMALSFEEPEEPKENPFEGADPDDVDSDGVKKEISDEIKKEQSPPMTGKAREEFETPEEIAPTVDQALDEYNELRLSPTTLGSKEYADALRKARAKVNYRFRQDMGISPNVNADFADGYKAIKSVGADILDDNSDRFYTTIAELESRHEFRKAVNARIETRFGIKASGSWSKKHLAIINNFEDMVKRLPKGHVITNKYIKRLQNHLTKTNSGYAFYQPSKKAISLSEKAMSDLYMKGVLTKSSEFDAVMSHEIGHAVYEKMAVKIKDSMDWWTKKGSFTNPFTGQMNVSRSASIAPIKPLLTDYASKNVGEMFAETYSVYFNNKGMIDTWLDGKDRVYAVRYRKYRIPSLVMEQNKDLFEWLRKNIFLNAKIAKIFTV